MVQFIPGRDDWGETLRSLGVGLGEGYMKRSDQNAIQRSLEGIPLNASARDILKAIVSAKTYSPEAKQQALQQYLGAENFDELKRKVQAQENLEARRIEAIEKKNVGEFSAEAYQNYLNAGYPEYQARILASPTTTPGEKNQIAQEHKELVARGIRTPKELRRKGEPVQEQIKPVAEQVEQAVEKPIAEELAKEVVAAQEAQEPEPVKPVAKEAPKEEWPKIEPPPETTPAEKEKWRDKNQTFNTKLLREVKEKQVSRKNSLIRYNRLSALNNSGKLPEGLGRTIIDPSTSEPYPLASLAGLVNAETQDFVKTMNDFFIDAKNYFGGRVTNFDLQSFKSRLPTLLNTDEGRRVIIEQMKLMEELQLVHDSELEKALRHYGRNASYTDIENVVEKRTVDKEDEVISKINNLDNAAKYLGIMAKDPKFKDMTLMQSPDGKFKAVPKDLVEAAKRDRYKVW